MAKPGTWSTRAVVTTALRWPEVPGHCPLPALWAPRARCTEEIIKETRKIRNLPAHQLSLVGHGFLAHPAGQETRAHGLPGAASQTLSTTWLFVHPLFGLQICEKQHLTKPAVTWRIIQSKKHHWHLLLWSKMPQKLVLI